MTQKNTKSYICNTTIDHGKRHAIGEPIKLTEDEAAALPAGAVTLDESEAQAEAEAPSKPAKK